MMEKMKEMKQTLGPYWHRILAVIVTLVVAILLLTIGFWATLLVAILVCIGYVIGTYMDDREKFYGWVGKINGMFDN